MTTLKTAARETNGCGKGKNLTRFQVPILLGWFESFAMQNIQAFFNNEVTNVNVCTKHKRNFILREFTSFVNKFEVVSLFRSSGK